MCVALPAFFPFLVVTADAVLLLVAAGDNNNNSSRLTSTAPSTHTRCTQWHSMDSTPLLGTAAHS